MSLKSMQQVEVFVYETNGYLNGDTDTKTAYALKKVLKSVESAAKIYQDDLEDLRIDQALTGEHDAVLRDDKGGYKFSKAGLKLLTIAAKKLHKEVKYEIASHFIENGDALTDDQRAAFDGFIIGAN